MRRLMAQVVVCVIAVVSGGSLLAQTPQVPGPEHDELMALVGTWDATIKMTDGTESKGTAVYRSACSGMWLESEFHGEFGGQKFEGRGMDSYDATRKLYTATWVDSMSGSPLIMTGTKEGKVTTMTGSMATADGEMKYKAVTTQDSADKFTFTMHMDAGGSFVEMMTIVYTRQKDTK
jgi:hypothetical protein